jgi:hypothetical protein
VTAREEIIRNESSCPRQFALSFLSPMALAAASPPCIRLSSALAQPTLTRLGNEEWAVAVGTEISFRPPHRSRRALLTHRFPSRRVPCMLGSTTTRGRLVSCDGDTDHRRLDSLGRSPTVRSRDRSKAWVGGDRQSAVRIAPDWKGPLPPLGQIVALARRGGLLTRFGGHQLPVPI